MFLAIDEPKIEPIPPKPRTDKRSQAKANLPETAVGYCANHYCGTVLFNEAAHVPPGWILIWHLNCGGYCPECILELNTETLFLWGINPAAQAKAQLILDTILPTASNAKDSDDEQ